MNVRAQRRQLDFKQVAQDYMDERVAAYIEPGGGGFIHFQGRNLVYDGKRYIEETDLAKRVRLFLMDRQLPHTNHPVSNLVGDIEAIASRGLDRFDRLPFYLGNDSFPKRVIPFQNGLLDLEAEPNVMRLMPHTPKWVSTFCLPFNYDENATCGEYDKWLEWALPDQDYRDLWHEWGGYCLTPDVSLQRFVIKHGPPGGGKGTADTILQAVLGAENCTGYGLRSLVRQFGLIPLVDKQAAFIGEVELTGCDNRAAILEILKSITGADPQLVEYKGRNDFASVVIPARLNISCNSVPKFFDETAALARRAILIPFKQSLPIERQNAGLTGRLLTELPGIANRFLEGLARLRRNDRFTMPGEMVAQLDRMRRDSSPAFAFLQDCLIVERRFDTGNLPGVAISDESPSCDADELRATFADWIADNPEYADKAFSWIVRDLTGILPGFKPNPSDRAVVEGRRIQVYRGLGIRPSPDGH